MQQAAQSSSSQPEISPNNSPWQGRGWDAAQINPVSSMICADESFYLHWLAREYYTGMGEIIDGGCLLGGSTVSLASGLRANPKVSNKRKRIHSYDLFTYVPGYRERIEVRGNLKEGDSLLPLFLENTHNYRQSIEVYPGDICHQHWNRQPIEICFVDCSKSWEINNHIIKEFFGYLIPGQSIVIQQDYYHYDCYWIHLTTQFLSPDYFQLIHRPGGGSVGFLLTREIPKELLEIDYSTYFTTEQAIALIDGAIAQEQGLGRLFLMTAKIRMLADRNEYEKACVVLREIRQSPDWEDWLLYDVVQAGNYLPFNMVFPGGADRSQILGISRSYYFLTHNEAVYAVPILSSDSLDITNPTVRSHSQLIKTRSPKEMTEEIGELVLPPPPPIPPELIEGFGLYNIVAWMGNYYGLPKELGTVDVSSDNLSQLQGVFIESSIDRLKTVIVNHLASPVEIERLLSRLQQTQTELERSHSRIQAMESSKFWKLRQVWFRLKRNLGLTKEV